MSNDADKSMTGDPGPNLMQQMLVPLAKYTTPDGRPTCAVNAGNGRYCRFLRFSDEAKTAPVCIEAAIQLSFYEEGRDGQIVPHKDCVVRVQTAVGVEPVNKLIREVRQVYVAEIAGRRVLVPATSREQAADTLSALFTYVNLHPTGPMTIAQWRPGD